MNFSFLESLPQLASLHETCCKAESFAIQQPTLSGITARKALEFIVELLYRIGVDKNPKANLSLFDMASDPRFEQFIGDETIIGAIHTARKIGNRAAHAADLTAQEACDQLEQLQYVIGETLLNLGLIEDYPAFESPLSKPKALEKQAKPAAVKNAEPLSGHAAEPSEENEASADSIEELAAEFAPKLRSARFKVSKKRDESENHRIFLRSTLREADWPIASRSGQIVPGAACINMTFDDGTSIDYVLYGRDSRPLAVVDCTRSNTNPIEGRRAALHAAEALGKKFGYKPIAYYTTGYHIFCIDQLGYPPRRVFGFHTMDELDLLKQRQQTRASIAAPSIDDNITNRDYQKQAIRSVCDAFSDNRRRSLLVMATGTGKTRVAISLSDILLKAGWVKNILFLADRTSLVRQAHKNFNKLLPNVTTSIYSADADNRDPNARIIFSTYQTMIKLVDGDAREFGIGRFDLIIVDEAHRSIFKKYGSLFRYFDALLVGLTATPRCEENKSTYEVFQLPNGKPDYAYELEEAIQDGYLVGFSVLDRTTEGMRNGLLYDDLTDEEKKQIEDAFSLDDPEDDGEFDGSVIKPGGNIINIGTIDAMLSDLMNTGLRIDAGDTLGKTIIFAKNHREAEVIVERFGKLYGHLGADFCKLIDSKVDNSLSLIDRFGERGSLPQIAVSVDMLDTGIDVPDILNLVFFKAMKSKIKFLQMIGRGTRLSPDIFGPGADKRGFLVLDYYDNFRYFNTHDTWSTTRGSGSSASSSSQSVRIDKRRLSILRQLQHNGVRNDFEKAYEKQILEYFLIGIRDLNNDAIEVAQNMAYVSKYRTEELWDGIPDDRARDIEERILPLLPPEKAPAKVKSFDHLMLSIEDEYLRRESEGKDPRGIRYGFRNANAAIAERMEQLLKLKTIPAVMKKEKLISALLDDAYLMDDFSLEKAEFVRQELRDLMSYIPDDRKYYVIDLPDTLIVDEEPSTIEKRKSYAERANEYLLDGSNVVLSKIRMLEPLSDDEKASLRRTFTQTLGTPADYASWSGNAPLLPFIRKQVGISDEAVAAKFGGFLNEETLDSQQIAYMRQMIDYARANGDITSMTLQSESPFCDFDLMKLFGAERFPYLKQLLDGLHRPVVE